MCRAKGTTMGIAKDLVDRQHEMLRRRDVTRVADLHAADGYFSMAAMRISPADLRRSCRPTSLCFPT
jgi:hypothetical protein